MRLRSFAGSALLGASLVGSLMSGCAPNRKLPEQVAIEKEAASEAKGTAKSVVSGGGNLERYTTEEPRRKLWTVNWKKAALDFDLTESEFGGRIQEVSGTFCKDGEVASTFVAREGFIDRGSKVIRLKGGVKVVSVKDDISIDCGELSYDGATGIIEAPAGVTAQMGGYVIREPEEVRVKIENPSHSVRTRPDLKKIGTSGLFDKS
ncbi:MAG: hypothetical protein ABL962_03075 [Fimbriimonadaceae bacterium]